MRRIINSNDQQWQCWWYLEQQQYGCSNSRSHQWCSYWSCRQVLQRSVILFQPQPADQRLHRQPLPLIRFLLQERSPAHQRYALTATITLSSTNNLGTYNAGGTGTAKWSSSYNSIATVAPNTGIVTGVAGGIVTITYTVTTDCGTSSSTYQVTVNPLPNAGTISGGLFVCTGSTTTLTSSVTGGTWSSSNTSVATVNATTGVVTGVAAGSSIITYTVTSATGCGTASNTATVTVGDLPNAGTVTGAATLCAGSTAIFTSDGTGGGSWSSNNTAAGNGRSVSGVVTGVAAGSATITYTVNGHLRKFFKIC